ncbi:two-component system response regulator YesN [Kineothrix alysoides]|uniref:Stage 0 sporulation protein A homolog n=1 Tax=Kineothrix alysoides TaxID=1469948 RepID=A0A4R1QLQ1_9FIRM|nr:helix-turn-helix domain-containing protein [Kineothrix alysoides]TCL54639.1 two-component system response regulator YesN [Kineothrix alysoides]
MYKIMIADDEGIVIDALKFIIERNFGDSCVIDSAKTGRSVIELAENFRPDIALMDIQMPGINGIEAMKEIQKSNKNIIFIVVSAYDKFDYAKEAIGLGVMDYINKPIEQKTIVSLLRKAMLKIDDDRTKRSNDLLVKEKLETVIPIIESGLIYSVLFQENYAEETENFKRLLGIEEDYGYMMVIEYGDTQDGVHLTNAIGASVRIHPNYMRLRETVKEYFAGIVGPMMANVVIVFVPCTDEDADNEYEERVKIIENARKMVRKLRNSIDAQFRIGIGSIKKLDEAGSSYTEAMNAFRYTTGSVAHAKDLPMECSYEEDYPIETEKKLFEKVQSGDVPGAVSEANRFFDWMISQYANAFMDIKLKAMEFVLWAEKVCYESGGGTYRFESRHDYLPTLFEFKNYEELRSWFLTKVRDAAGNVLNNKEKTSVSLVEQAKEYIRSHYFKDISLDDVSREVNISPYYFSKLFKEETGENFIEYVTSIRMEKAKELLARTEKSMKEICSEVGYSDPNYFSRSFKKNVGVTPTEYKEGK